MPAIRPDVAFVHAWRADEDGNVQLPWPPDHLADVDAARGTGRADDGRVGRGDRAARGRRGAPERTRLFGFEVDLLVEAPGGARPGSVPPLYEDDAAWLAEHGDDPAGALLAD